MGTHKVRKKQAKENPKEYQPRLNHWKKLTLREIFLFNISSLKEGM